MIDLKDGGGPNSDEEMSDGDGGEEEEEEEYEERDPKEIEKMNQKINVLLGELRSDSAAPLALEIALLPDRCQEFFSALRATRRTINSLALLECGETSDWKSLFDSLLENFEHCCGQLSTIELNFAEEIDGECAAIVAAALKRWTTVTNFQITSTQLDEPCVATICESIPFLVDLIQASFMLPDLRVQFAVEVIRTKLVQLQKLQKLCFTADHLTECLVPLFEASVECPVLETFFLGFKTNLVVGIPLSLIDFFGNITFLRCYPLHFAAATGNLARARDLLAAKADVNQIDSVSHVTFFC